MIVLQSEQPLEELKKRLEKASEKKIKGIEATNYPKPLNQTASSSAIQSLKPKL